VIELEDKDSQNSIIKVANDFIENYRSPLTVFQKKLIYMVARQVRTDDEDFQDYIVPVKDIAVEILGLPPSAAKYIYNYINEETTKLFAKPLFKRTDDGWIKFSWFTRLEYIGSQGILKARFSPELKPVFLFLKSRFTKLPYSVLINLKLKHTDEIYALLKEYEGVGKREIDLQTLKTKLMVEYDPAYKKYYDFKRYILNPCIKEINEKTDIEVSFKEVKQGRKVFALSFYIKTKNKSQQQPVSTSETSASAELPTLETSTSASEDTSEVISEDAPVFEDDIIEKRLNYLLSFVPDKYRNDSLKELLKEFLQLPDDVIVSNIKYTVEQKPTNFNGYLRRSLSEDYAKEYREKESIAEQKEEAKEQQRRLEELQGFYISYSIYKAKSQMTEEERKALREEAIKVLEKKREPISDYRLEGIEYNILRQHLKFEDMPKTIEELQVFKDTHVEEYKVLKDQLNQTKEPQEDTSSKEDLIKRLVDERFNSIVSNKDSEDYKQLRLEAIQQVKKINPGIDTFSIPDATLFSLMKGILRERILKERGL
jgi:plasmid replication initiation protein